MTQDEIRTLFAYNAWANHRVLEACAALTPQQFTQTVTSSFPSIRDTLFHIMGVEWLYFERWHGRSPSTLLPGEHFDDLAAMRGRWQQIERSLTEYVSGPELGDTGRALQYLNMQGNPFAYPLRAMLQHMVNHSTYHRGQVTTQLRQLGARPLSTDLLRYYDVLAGLPAD
jgi:uncharacterized damage-inducible protein DinB